MAGIRANNQILSLLLPFFPNIDIQDLQGRTALHGAAHAAHWDTCEFLLSFNANINATDSQGRSALFWCLTQSGAESVHQNILECIKNLISAKANPNIQDNLQRTPLHYSAYYSLYSCVEYFMDFHRYDPNTVDSKNQSSLHAAVSNENILDTYSKPVVALLLSRGARLDISSSSNGFTPLHLACLKDKSTSSLLLLHSALEHHIPLESGNSVKSILHLSAEHALTQIALTCLHDNPESFEAVDSQGSTVFHSIAKGGSHDLFEQILESQNRETIIRLFSQVDHFQRSPFHVAAGGDQIEIIQTFINFAATEAKELLNSPDKFGNYPAHYAALRNRIYTLSFLLEEFPESISVVNSRNQTLLHAAVCGGGSLDCVQQLLSSGANVNALDSLGKSPLFYAVEQNNVDLFRMLVVEYSADLNQVDLQGRSLSAVVLSSKRSEEMSRILKDNAPLA